MTAAFAVAAAFAGVGVIAAGAFLTGLLIVALGGFAAVLATAAGASLGETPTVKTRPDVIPIIVVVAGGAMALLAWPHTPPPLVAPAAPAPVMAAPRAADLLIALAGFAAAVAAIVGVLGFGARGLFGAGRAPSP
jgi:hypothetical protein